jgi:[protein-PII] uridylyltransferase
MNEMDPHYQAVGLELQEALTRHGDTITAYRESLRAADEQLHERFRAGERVDRLVHNRARLVDELLTHAWARFLPADAGDVGLVAVGGYGRGELHPHSDVDLMVLLAEDVSTHDDAIRDFLTFTWDIGLEVGHSVRTLAECEQQSLADITVATNLMECRLLAGPRALFEAMRERVSPKRCWNSRDFFAAKLREQEQRHQKFHDTAYNLEPNIKEGPGGLRDIQMIDWVAKRHFGAERLSALVTHGFLTEAEYHALKDGQRFLWALRYALHLLTGRREDRLLFDHQKAVAAQFGYHDEGHNLAVEQLMQRYYRTVMELSRLNEMLLQLFQETLLYAGDSDEPVTINRRFQARHGFIEVSDERVFERQPSALLEIFLILQQHPDLKGVRASTIRLIRANRHLIDDDYRADLRNRSLFLEILRQPRGITHELRRMNRYGILARYLPAFGRIVGRMQYDLFHAYTVDEHTLFVVRNLRRLSVPEYAHELPLCSNVAQRIPKPELLYLAGLFHDIAKGRGGDHSELGAEEAERFCRNHGFGRYDTHLVAWLVRNHLLMSMTTQRKDINDPEVINEFARRVGDATHLDYLYLLTVADIRATNSNLWNSWKDALLAELFTATQRALRRGLENPIDSRELIAEVREDARRHLHGKNVSDQDIEDIWRRFDEDFFLQYSAEEVAWHTAVLAEYGRPDGVLVQVRDFTQRGGTEVFVYAPDQKGLFARTVRTLDQLGLTVLDARIFTSADGHSVNTIIVLESDGSPIRGAFREQEIRDRLAAVLERGDDADTGVSRRLPRQIKHFQTRTQVRFSQDRTRGHTIMELFTTDRPGLLAKVGQAFIDCGIRLKNARVATIGARAEDAFLITDWENRPIEDQERLDRLKGRLVELLDTRNGT